MNNKNEHQAINLSTVKYIMVTDFEDHWEGLVEKRKGTSFSKSLIEPLIFRSKFPEEPVATLFIKKQANKITGSWVGECSEFKWGRNKNEMKLIRFNVSGLQSIVLPKEFRNHKIGWHVNKRHHSANEHLRPLFLKEMEHTEEWIVFELYCHYLFKLIGINTMHPFPIIQNKGKADGEFILNDLYVLYDATLNAGFMESKEEQIEKYITKMRHKRTVTIGKQQYPLQGIQKQIWIITRGNEVIHIKPRINTSIIVKEVPFHKLEAIYYKRLHEEINETGLCNLLKNL
jgi:hypothetical protein